MKVKALITIRIREAAQYSVLGLWPRPL